MSVHQFVHLGDGHFGPHGGPGKNADRYAALDQIIGESRVLPHLRAWVWPGDVNDGRMTIEDRNALSRRLITMAEVAPVVLCYGNHDAPGDLDIFGRLATKSPILVAATPQVFEIPRDACCLHVACLPYPTRAGLIAAGCPADQTLEAGRTALTAVAQALAARFDELSHHTRGREVVSLTIGHVNVGGALASVGQPQIGRELELEPAALTILAPYGYVGLNHIHKPQTIYGAVYAGSIAPMDWGEMEDKRYVVATYDDERHTWTTQSRPLAVPPMVHVEGDLTREGFTWHVAKQLGGPAIDIPGAFFFAGVDVRVRFTYSQAERAALDFERVSIPFAQARHVKLDPVPILTRPLRAPQVAAARTLRDKVLAYCDQAGVPATETLLAKLDRLTAPAGEQEEAVA